MFEPQVFETVLGRMLTRVKSNFDKREGSIIFDGTAPAGFEIAVLYAALDYILNETFADTAAREHLLRRAAEYGERPKAASYAELLALCSGVEVPPGTSFSLEDSELNYTVLEQLEGLNPGDYSGIDFSGKQAYRVRCDTIGAIGNRYFGALLPNAFLAGLQSADLVALLIPGEDEQETESFREDYLDSFQGKDFGGNRKDYVKKVKAIKGVGAVKVYPVWNHDMVPENMVPKPAVDSWYNNIINAPPADVVAWLESIYTAAKNLWLTVGGTVKLVVLGANLAPASADLVDEVQTAVDPEQNHGEGLGVAPIGHIVNVFSAGTTPVDINYAYTLRPGCDWGALLGADVNPAVGTVRRVIDDYFLELTKDWGMDDSNTYETRAIKVVVSQLANRLLDLPGIEDIDLSTLTLNGSGANLTLHPDNIPIRGVVNGT